METTLNLPGVIIQFLRNEKTAYGSEEKYLMHLIIKDLNMKLNRYSEEIKCMENKYGSYERFEDAVMKGEIEHEDTEDVDSWHVGWRDLMRWRSLKEARDSIEQAIINAK